jgi:uncharacterized protein with FMN-binding domain
MKTIRGTALRALALAAIAGLLASCVVNKADLIKRVDLHDVDLSKVPDGVYVGAYTINPPFPETAANKSAEVRVTVAGGKYTQIELIKPPQLSGSGSFAPLLANVKNTQRLSVDAVTSATITSVAILKAIQTAVSSRAAGSSQ